MKERLDSKEYHRNKALKALEQAKKLEKLQIQQGAKYVLFSNGNYVLKKPSRNEL